MIALPVFGYKSHISIDRRSGFIREMAVTSASAADGHLLRQVVSTDNTSSKGMGRQGLSLYAQREVVVGSDVHVPDSSAQTHGEGNRTGQRREILDPGSCRTCLRP